MSLDVEKYCNLRKVLEALFYIINVWKQVKLFILEEKLIKVDLLSIIIDFQIECFFEREISVDYEKTNFKLLCRKPF